MGYNISMTECKLGTDRVYSRRHSHTVYPFPQNAWISGYIRKVPHFEVVLTQDPGTAFTDDEVAALETNINEERQVHDNDQQVFDGEQQVFAGTAFTVDEDQQVIDG